MNFRIKSYLNFLWKSTNEHGVHSPFVFHLLTQSIYSKKVSVASHLIPSQQGPIAKKQQLLFKVIRYFEPEIILALGATTLENEIIAAASPNASLENDRTADFYHCIYCSSHRFCSMTPDKIEELLASTENDSFWILENIHANSTSESIWNTLKNHPKVTVTVDTYHFGLVFFRSEQAKEHFVIRA